MENMVAFLEIFVATVTVVVAISRSNRALEQRLTAQFTDRIESCERNLATEIRALAAVTDARFETVNYRLGVLEAGRASG